MASEKAIGLAPTESSVEADGLLDMEYDRAIARFQVQPETIRLQVEGTVRSYTPDARYVHHTGVIGYTEFKHSDRPPDAQMSRKLEAVHADYGRRGFQFEVVESNALRRGFRMDNLRTLRRYSAWSVSRALREQVLQFLQTAEKKTLGDLRQVAGSAGLGGMYRMLWDQEVGVELESVLLCDTTPVWEVPA